MRTIAATEKIVAAYPELDIGRFIAQAYVAKEPRRRDEGRADRAIRRVTSRGEADDNSQNVGEGAHR
jgi:hypothetical protein